MIRLFSSKLSLGLFAAFCGVCAAAQTSIPAAQIDQPSQKPAPAGQMSETEPEAVEQLLVEAPVEPNVVAEIGAYVITKQELEKRLMTELYPRRYESYTERDEPPDANTVLMTMIAEKAMVMEARKQDLLEDETTRALVRRYKHRKLAESLLGRHLKGQVVVTEAEIKQKMQDDPNLDEARAKAGLEREKTNTILGRYYSEMYERSHVKKLSENFPKAIEIYQRLLYRPKTPRKVRFVRASQIADELTPEEQNIVLAEYNRGKVTLKDWLETLCNFSPPSRPKDLNTPEGVERLLERALRMPLLVSEAESLGLDKEPALLKLVRENEDGRLLSAAKLARYKQVPEPKVEQIIAYFGEHKEAFATSDSLKIELIWCQDLMTARQAKAALDGGMDFESVRKKYSFEEKGRPFNTYPSSEGLFWKDLWAGEPNDVIGPVKGFYRQGVKWRIVKILEKKSGELREYSNDMESQVKNRMMTEQRDAVVAKYSEELLKKYPYKIYAGRIKDIDLLNIP